MINGFAFNTTLINGATRNKRGENLILPLEINVSEPSQVGYASVNLRINTSGKGRINLPLTVKISPPKASLLLPLKIKTFSKSSLSLPLALTIYNRNAFVQQSQRWKVKLILGGIDVSANLTDVLRVEAEEGSAKIAEFTLIPFTGPISPTQWLGKSVVISYQLFDVDYKLLSDVLIFQGIVNEPVYDPTSRLTRFVCSDQLQEQVGKLSQEQLNTLVQGYWSPIVFETSNDNWQHAQDLLSTVPYSLDIDRSNVLQATPWKAKARADLSFTENEIFYQSIEVQLADRREIHNHTQIKVQYRYSRLKQREILYEYRYPYSFCEQSYKNSTLPNVDMIAQAVEGTGWLLKDNIHYVHQRGPGWVTCDGVAFGYLISEELRKFLVREARFILARRFVQTITENFILSVIANQSVEQLGEVMNYDSFAFEFVTDKDKFIKVEQYQPPITGSVLDKEGDYVWDADERVELNQAIITKLNQAKTSILKSHRNNLVSFKIALNPLIERHHTVNLDTTNVKAQGKVKHIIHECDFNQGRCESSITIAISQTDSNLEGTNNTLNAPTKISSPVIGLTTPRKSLPTYLGGKRDSPTFDDSWEGYSGNEHIQPGAQPYPERFVIATPAIENEQVPIEYSASLKYSISIPNEYLLLSA